MTGARDSETTTPFKAKLSRDTLRKVAAVEDALAHYSLDGDNVQASIDALRTLLDTDKVFFYTLSQRPEGEDLTVERGATASYPQAQWRSVFDGYLRGRGVSWGGYHAIRPEPAQRDRVLRRDEIAVLTDGRSLVVDEDLGRRLGTFGEDMMRVLVCDGPSMLAWLGIIQPEPTTERQRALFECVVPAFRRRLQFERAVGETSCNGHALEAALEALNGAAWVLGSHGRVLHANTAGRARFDVDPTGTRRALDACTAGSHEARFKVTPLRDADGDGGHVVVEVMDRGAANQVSKAAERWVLTPAQARVLDRVAWGMSNATIAAELKVAERTVEAHVTALLEKAQVSSRAALIVQIFRSST